MHYHSSVLFLKVRKNRLQKTTTTLLQKRLNNDVARFTTVLTCQHGFNVGSKTRNIAFKLVLQQCC